MHLISGCTGKIFRKAFNLNRKLLFFLNFLLIFSSILPAQDKFRIFPYLQNPDIDAITILWFSEENSPGLLSWWKKGTATKTFVNSTPVPAEALKYSLWEDSTFFEGQAPSAPFLHRIRIENLDPSSIYEYEVAQGTETFSSSFHTGPDGNAPVRFIVYGDSETEPESTGKFTTWVDPVNDSVRAYLTDQTTGYKNNLEVIRSREPDLVFIAGDLVETGGEQRDWDEFWRHNTGSSCELSLAGKIPVMAALGNHEYYEGLRLDGYNQPGSERAVKKFLTYFESPSNNPPVAEHEGRYYSLKYGPATFIVLDVCNNSPNKSNDDTNFYLLGESDQDGGKAPDFGPSSDQYIWLEGKLREAQLQSMFTFLIFHHSPYSSGPHGYPAGEAENTDEQSGYPVRILTSLFIQYGVDAVISAHDEMWERSTITGTEKRPDQTERSHTIHFYDVGQGGDGLREPEKGLYNPDQQFLVHNDVPEIWENGILKDGGKHYGHLEVDILPADADTWQAILRPVYIFPLFNSAGSEYSLYERRIYNDEVTLIRYLSDMTVSVSDALPDRQNNSLFSRSYPNPFYSEIEIEYFLPESSRVKITVFDLSGKVIRILEESNNDSGVLKVVWNGKNEAGNYAQDGIYIYRIETSSGLTETGKIIYLNSVLYH